MWWGRRRVFLEGCLGGRVGSEVEESRYSFGLVMSIFWVVVVYADYE